MHTTSDAEPRSCASVRGVRRRSLATACLLQVMYRERAAGMYDELPFAAAQCLIELPYNLLQALLFAAIAYFMMGFETDAGAC